MTFKKKKKGRKEEKKKRKKEKFSCLGLTRSQKLKGKDLNL